MISDPDIYRAAKLLIDQHGEDAPLRADEQLAEGDIDGVEIWRAILVAIEEPQRARGPEDSVN